MDSQLRNLKRSGNISADHLAQWECRIGNHVLNKNKIFLDDNYKHDFASCMCENEIFRGIELCKQDIHRFKDLGWYTYKCKRCSKLIKSKEACDYDLHDWGSNNKLGVFQCIYCEKIKGCGTGEHEYDDLLLIFRTGSYCKKCGFRLTEKQFCDNGMHLPDPIIDSICINPSCSYHTQGMHLYEALAKSSKLCGFPLAIKRRVKKTICRAWGKNKVASSYGIRHIKQKDIKKFKFPTTNEGLKTDFNQIWIQTYKNAHSECLNKSHYRNNDTFPSYDWYPVTLDNWEWE